MKHMITLAEWSKNEIMSVFDKALDLKAHPEKYSDILKNRTLLMIFEKPSLRTHLSFETGMTQMGGHAIYYNTSHSPLGKGKESIEDTARVLSRYVDIVLARTYSHQQICEIAKYATIPVINALSNFSHPCQVMADLLTAYEKKGKLEGLKLAYCGDANNNVTHSLMYGCAQVGMDISIACPEGDDFCPNHGVYYHAKSIAEQQGHKVIVNHNAIEAVRDADVVYTDSWMSYHIKPEEEAARIAVLKPFQVTEKLMEYSKPDSIFMNCLPALREYEQTTGVIDGPHSVVFDEAENRLHVQKAIILTLLGK